MNKNFKKILACILACMTITSLAAPSFSALADEVDRHENVNGYTYTDIDTIVEADFTGTYDEKIHSTTAENIEADIVEKVDHESTPRIYVEVEWDELKFVYDFGTVVDYEWNVQKLRYDPVYEYENNEGPAWDKTSADITFTNYSNREVYCYAYFEPNANTDAYDNVTFDTKNHEVLLETAVGRDELDSKSITFEIEGAPEKTFDPSDVPPLGTMYFAISEETRIEKDPVPEHVCNKDVETDTAYYCSICGELVEKKEHECHFVYDQFGRLVCTGCNKVKHEYCIDEDEDGLCDECGLERDFCPDCHVGGTCRCT